MDTTDENYSMDCGDKRKEEALKRASIVSENERLSMRASIMDSVHPPATQLEDIIVPPRSIEKDVFASVGLNSRRPISFPLHFPDPLEKIMKEERQNASKDPFVMEEEENSQDNWDLNSPLIVSPLQSQSVHENVEKVTNEDFAWEEEIDEQQSESAQWGLNEIDLDEEDIARTDVIGGKMESEEKCVSPLQKMEAKSAGRTIEDCAESLLFSDKLTSELNEDVNELEEIAAENLAFPTSPSPFDFEKASLLDNALHVNLAVEENSRSEAFGTAPAAEIDPLVGILTNAEESSVCEPSDDCMTAGDDLQVNSMQRTSGIEEGALFEPSDSNLAAEQMQEIGSSFGLSGQEEGALIESSQIFPTAEESHLKSFGDTFASDSAGPLFESSNPFLTTEESQFVYSQQCLSSPEEIPLFESSNPFAAANDSLTTNPSPALSTQQPNDPSHPILDKHESPQFESSDPAPTMDESLLIKSSHDSPSTAEIPSHNSSNPFPTADESYSVESSYHLSTASESALLESSNPYQPAQSSQPMDPIPIPDEEPLFGSSNPFSSAEDSILHASFPVPPIEEQHTTPGSSHAFPIPEQNFQSNASHPFTSAENSLLFESSHPVLESLSALPPSLPSESESDARISEGLCGTLGSLQLSHTEFDSAKAEEHCSPDKSHTNGLCETQELVFPSENASFASITATFGGSDRTNESSYSEFAYTQSVSTLSMFGNASSMFGSDRALSQDEGEREIVNDTRMEAMQASEELARGLEYIPSASSLFGDGNEDNAFRASVSDAADANALFASEERLHTFAESVTESSFAFQNADESTIFQNTVRNMPSRDAFIERPIWPSNGNVETANDPFTRPHPIPNDPFAQAPIAQPQAPHERSTFVQPQAPLERSAYTQPQAPHESAVYTQSQGIHESSTFAQPQALQASSAYTQPLFFPPNNAKVPARNLTIDTQRHTNISSPIASPHFRSPVAFDDPNIPPPSCLISFGFGGNLVTMFPKRKILLSSRKKAPYVPTTSLDSPRKEELRKGPVHLYHVSQLYPKQLFYDHFESFPGPLTRDTPQQTILQYIESKLTSCGDDERLLLLILKALIQENSDDVISAGPVLLPLLQQSQERRERIRSVDVPNPNFLEPKNTPILSEQIRSHLLCGDRKGAVQAAITGNMWPEAMLIASFIDKDEYKRVLHSYLDRHYASADPCRTLYMAFADQQEKSVQNEHTVSPNVLDNYVSHAQMLIANRTCDTHKILTELGDRLWHEQNSVMPAHICYLLAGIPVEAPSLNSKIALLGADHRTSKEARFYVSPSAVQRTEIYEWIHKRSNPMSNMIPFQGYKLIHAMILADHGKLESSFQYVSTMLAILRNVTANMKPGTSLYLEGMQNQLMVLDDRLRQHLGQDRAESVANSGKQGNKWGIGSALSIMGKIVNRVVEGPDCPSFETSTASAESSLYPAIPQMAMPAPVEPPAVMYTAQPVAIPAPPDRPSVTQEPRLQVKKNPLTRSFSGELHPNYNFQRSHSAMPSNIPHSERGSSPLKKEVQKKMRSKTPPPSSSKSNPSGWFSGLSSFIVTKMNPEAKVAKLGEQMEAYFDEENKRWVFPGEAAVEEAPVMTAPPVAPLDRVSAPPGHASPASESKDPLAALMTPPVSRAHASLMQKDPLAAMMAPPSRIGSRATSAGSQKKRTIPPRPQFAVFKPGSKTSAPNSNRGPQGNHSLQQSAM